MDIYEQMATQTDFTFEVNAKVTKTTMAEKATQKPTDEDILDEIVETVEPITVAQTQLNLLVDTLEKLKSEGLLNHLSLDPEGKYF